MCGLAARVVDGLRRATHQALHLRAGWFRTGNSREARQCRNILAEVRSGTEIVIPSAHILPRRRESRALPVDLEQAILTEIQKERMIFIELPFQRTAQQFDGAVGKGG